MPSASTSTTSSFTRWASKRFEETVAEQDADFAVELAALRTAVSGGPVTQKPPAASEITREQLWKELVSARADLLGWEYDAAKSHDPSQSPVAEQEEDLRALLKQGNESLVQLRDRMEVLATGLRATSAADDRRSPSRQRGEPGRQRRSGRAKSAARLEQLHAQIAQLEEAVGEQPENARDVHVVRELERLRALVAEVEEQARGGQKRLPALPTLQAARLNGDRRRISGPARSNR